MLLFVKNNKKYLMRLFGLAILSFTALLFSNGKWAIPVITWLSPILLIRLLRIFKNSKGVFIGYIIYIISFIIVWNGIMPVSGVLYYIIASVFGTIFYSPYIIDRLIVNKRNYKFVLTLLLPATATVIEYIVSQFSPFGSWASVAYTQSDNLVLLQILSITGLWGVTFIVYWFGSIINWIWNNNCEWNKIRTGSVIYLFVFLLVFVWGGFKLNILMPKNTSVRIAGITGPDFYLFSSNELRQKFIKNVQLTVEEENIIKESSYKIHDYYFEKSQKEIYSGAKIIVWPEIGVRVLYTDQDSLIKKCQTFARQHNIYLCATLLVMYYNNSTTLQGKLAENKVIMITPEGGIAFLYDKAKLVPGMDNTSPGDSRAALLKTPYGIISSRICFDMDFPGLIRQTGSDGVDIMLDAANEWRTITKIHTQMAVYRAIENGFSLIKQTNHGQSIATDYCGRVLAAIEYNKSTDNIMVAQVPIKGVRTLYSTVGDLFAWLCGGFLLWLIIYRIKYSKLEGDLQ